jgi:hypothetical protein
VSVQRLLRDRLAKAARRVSRRPQRPAERRIVGAEAAAAFALRAVRRQVGPGPQRVTG